MLVVVERLDFDIKKANDAEKVARKRKEAGRYVLLVLFSINLGD